MSAHEREREELLAAVAANELSADDPRVQALLAGHPRLGAELVELEALAGDLDASGKLARDVLAEAATRRQAPGAERIAATLRAEIARTTRAAPPPAPARARGARWPWIVAACAAGALLWSTLRDRAGDANAPGARDLELGGATIDGLTPAGAVTELGEFRWRSTAPRDGFFELQIDDARRTFAGEEQLLARIPGLLEPRWTPDARSAGWPARIRWRVRALDGSRAEIGRSEWVEVERAP